MFKRSQTNTRFRVVTAAEAKKCGYLESEDYYADDYRGILYEFDGDTPVRVLGVDGGEPEDQTFGRDWSWVVPELNRLSERAEKAEATLAAKDRIRTAAAERAPK